MRLFHVTTKRGRFGICKDDMINPALATGGMKASWFVPMDLVEWAILHVMRRHGVPLRDVRILSISLPGGEFSEHAGSRRFFRKLPTTILDKIPFWSTAEQWVDEDPGYGAQLPEGVKNGG